ncbi:MAG: calcium-binding protein [Planctomycetaceae bacterium]
MAKQPNKKSTSTQWTDALDPKAIEESREDACVDAYDEYEQHTGFMTALEEELKFPFSAKVLGDNMTVVGMEWPEDSEFGLDLVIERNGDKHRIDARSVELVQPLPEGHLTLAAYLQWRRFV